MKTATERISPEGLKVELSLEDLGGTGWRPGQEVSMRIGRSGITIRAALSAEEQIVARALAFLDRHVGDAATVGLPERQDDAWQLPVYLSYAEKRLGVLAFDAAGQLVKERSTAPEAMRRAAADAA